ncbi:glycerol-3-phosphate cytidyltransferase [Lentisphaera araneosa HTCC2155]|uniref:Glycerol-3-phosphate cytidyltransferase n=2 Tax=Lentisphaera TaxID=256846 RepID=A6DQF9_9BACT|nr:glycerol-3-phosphate cytidyltransferase [Lentisphaera araneosa HTCC2155]
MFHEGHLRLLKRAKALGDHLIVGVTDENYDRSRGKLNVIESTEKRVQTIRDLDFVDEVVIETHKKQKAEDMQKYGIDIFAIGDDWEGFFDYLNEFTEVVYLSRTEGISSTLLRKENYDLIKLGIVGLGEDTKAFIEEATHIPNLRVNRIYSSDVNDLKKVTKEDNGVNYGHDNYDEFLDSSISAVYIDTALEEHYPLIRKALEANKHVLCENPLALHKSELRELLNLAKTKELLLLSAIRTAFLPAFNQLLSELKNGLIGDIKQVKATRTSSFKDKIYPDTFMTQGATNILSSYPSLLVNKILGRSKDITFFDQGTDNYDVSNLIISKHKNGGIGISNVATGIQSKGDAIISGTKGYVYIPSPWWLTKKFKVNHEDDNKSQTYKYEFDGCGLRYMIAEFVSLIQRGERKSKMLSPKDMIGINRVLLEYNERKIKQLEKAQ